jgi:hypothetical protein
VTLGSSSPIVRRIPLMVRVIGRLMRCSDENCFGMIESARRILSADGTEV